MDMTLILAVAVTVGGLAAVATGVSRRKLAADPTGYLHDLEIGMHDEDEGDTFTSRMRLPFLSRVMRPLGAGFVDKVTSLTPRNHVAKVHRQLLLAGLSSSVRAEEFITAQAIATGAGLTLGLLGATLLSLSTSKATLIVVLFPAIGALAPATWLSRKVQERQDAKIGRASCRERV